MARFTTHPRRRDRRERALALVERQILRMQTGFLPTAKEWISADYYDARYGNPAEKIKKAEICRDNLKRKLNLT